jgi:hypothetical protein
MTTYAKWLTLHRKVFTLLFLVLLVPLISFATFQDSFRLGLIGDDWLMLYTIRMIFDIQKSLNFLNIHAYFCTYCPPYSILSVIKYFWGYNPIYYFVLSLLLRIGISWTLFFVVRKFTKSIAASFLVALFYSVNYIGLQTTEWVFNHNHYAGIILAGISLIWYWKAKEKFRFKNIFVSAFFFALALIMSPPRMHGFFPLLVFAEFFWLFIEGKGYSWKNGVIRLATVLLAYRIVFSIGGAGYGTNLYLGIISESLKAMQDNLIKGEYTFLLNPITTLGNYILPDSVVVPLVTNQTKLLSFLPQSMTFLASAVLSCFFVITTPILKLVRSTNRQIIYYLLASGVFVYLLRVIKRVDSTTFSNDKLIYTLIGGQVIIFSFFLFLELKKRNRLLAHGLLVGLAWTISYTLFPWLLAPNSILTSAMRYSVQQGAGLCVFVATLVAVVLQNYSGKKRNKVYIPAFIIAAIISMTFMGIHYLSTKDYLGNLVAHRSIDIDRRLWGTIKSEVPSLDTEEGPSIFYLTYDDYYMAEWVLRFGFSARTSIVYEINDQTRIPTMIYDFKDLLSIVTNGEVLSKYGMVPAPIPVNRIYAFDLKEGILQNKTNEVRAELMQEVVKATKNNSAK